MGKIIRFDPNRRKKSWTRAEDYGAPGSGPPEDPETRKKQTNRKGSPSGLPSAVRRWLPFALLLLAITLWVVVGNWLAL